MLALKRNAWLVFALLVLQILWPGSLRSQVPSSPAFKEEMSRQDAIYQDRGGRVTEGYVINRALLAYADALAPEFDRSLANLGPEGRWLDIGAGEGHAILDYYTSKYDETHEAGRSRRGSKASAWRFRSKTGEPRAGTRPPAAWVVGRSSIFSGARFTSTARRSWDDSR